MNYLEKNKTNILYILELSEKWLIPNIYKWLAKQTRKLKSQAKKILLSNYLKEKYIIKIRVFIKNIKYSYFYYMFFIYGLLVG